MISRRLSGLLALFIAMDASAGIFRLRYHAFHNSIFIGSMDYAYTQFLGETIGESQYSSQLSVSFNMPVHYNADSPPHVYDIIKMAQESTILLYPLTGLMQQKSGNTEFKAECSYAHLPRLPPRCILQLPNWSQERFTQSYIYRQANVTPGHWPADLVRAVHLIASQLETRLPQVVILPFYSAAHPWIVRSNHWINSSDSNNRTIAISLESLCHQNMPHSCTPQLMSVRIEMRREQERFMPCLISLPEKGLQFDVVHGCNSTMPNNPDDGLVQLNSPPPPPPAPPPSPEKIVVCPSNLPVCITAPLPHITMPEIPPPYHQIVQDAYARMRREQQRAGSREQSTVSQKQKSVVTIIP